MKFLFIKQKLDDYRVMDKFPGIAKKHGSIITVKVRNGASSGGRVFGRKYLQYLIWNARLIIIKSRNRMNFIQAQSMSFYDFFV